MAIKNYMTIEDLTLYKSLYDNQVADAIDTAASQSLHTVAIDGHTLKFYREKEPVGSATPAYSITLPETDISNLLKRLRMHQVVRLLLQNQMALLKSLLLQFLMWV